VDINEVILYIERSSRVSSEMGNRLRVYCLGIQPSHPDQLSLVNGHPSVGRWYEY